MGSPSSLIFTLKERQGLALALRLEECGVEFSAVTYTAQSVSYAPVCFEEVSDSSSSLTNGLAAFLLRVAAYFQGYLASFPRMASSYQQPAMSQESLPESVTVMDPALEGSSEPLVKVRMNRALRRRMRWLIKRGRVQRSGRLRVCNAAAEARCNLTPGQMREYNIRVNGLSRTVTYGLNRGGHVQNKGTVLSFGIALLCNAILTPD